MRVCEGLSWESFFFVCVFVCLGFEVASHQGDLELLSSSPECVRFAYSPLPRFLLRMLVGTIDFSPEKCLYAGNFIV